MVFFPTTNWRLGAALASFIILAGGPSLAQTAHGLFAGKTMRVIVGYPPGSTFDTYSRALTRHISRHTPGNPTWIVQNMPGAGSLTATNYIANVAPKDGTVLGMPNPVNLVEPLLNPSNARFDSRKFTWIGSMNAEISACAFWTNNVKTHEDMLKKRVIIGTTGPAAGSTLFAHVLMGTMGYDFKLIPGYPGLNEVRLAAMQGEVDGHCGLLVSSLKTDYWDEYKSGRIHIPLQMAVEKHPEIANVPNVFDMVKSSEDKQVLLLAFGPWKFGRPVMGPEGIPEDRTKVLRAAFMDTVTDRAFLEEARKINLEIQPIQHEEITGILREIFETSPAVIERTRKIMGIVQ
jgi:tripartite-type tricarboxylate transporter receptor subunit TctC